METSCNSVLSERGCQQFHLLKFVIFSRIHIHSYGYLKAVPYTSVSAYVCRVLIFTCNDHMQIILFSMNRVTKRIKQIHLVKMSVSVYKYAGKIRQLEL